MDKVLELNGGKLWHALVRNELSNMQRTIILFFLFPTPLVFVVGQQIKASKCGTNCQRIPANTHRHTPSSELPTAEKEQIAVCIALFVRQI